MMTMRKLILILALLLPLPVFGFTVTGYTNYSSGSNGITVTFSSSAGDTAVVWYYQNSASSPAISLCGGTVTPYVFYRNNAGTKVTVGIANNLPSGCTTATGSNVTVSPNSIVVNIITGAQANLPLENFNFEFFSSSSFNYFDVTAGAPENSSELLVIGDNLNLGTLAESLPGMTLSAHLLGSETGGGVYTPTQTAVSTWYGAVNSGTYTNRLSGLACGSTCDGHQFMIFLRSTLPHLGVVQFSQSNPSGSGASTTCSLPFPPIAGDMVYGFAVPYGSADTVAIPTDSAGNTYVHIGSSLPTTNGAGQGFYANNITAGTFPLTLTFATQNAGSATVFDCEVGEIHGAAATSPYAASLQEVVLNYVPTTTFGFGPLTLPAGNSVLVGTGWVGSHTMCETSTAGGFRLGQCIQDTNGLANTYATVFANATPTTMTVTSAITPPNNLPYSWFGFVISDTPQPDGLLVQSAGCSYSCLPTSGTLKTDFNVTTGNTGVVWFNNNSSTVAPTISDSLLNTWTPFCTFVANAPYYGWYATNMHGGAKDVISFTNLFQAAPVFVELSQVNASGFDGSACNGGTTAGGSGTTYNSGPVTTSKTDLILSLGSFTHGFGDAPVSQTDACNAPVSSLFSDYSGSQISACYSQAPGTYTSADYWSTASGQVGAAILAFNNSTQPGNGVTAIKAQAKIHGKAVVK